jgi:hypothetical protein
MNKFQELKTQPVYNFRIQKQANDLPPFAKGRMDKYSNYQSVLNDLTSPILDFQAEVTGKIAEISLHSANVNDSTEFHLYAAENPERTVLSNSEIYKLPTKVTAYNFNGEENLDLFTVERMDKEDLNDRLPLKIKSIDEKTKSVTVLEYVNRKEYLIRVKETCFLGFEIIPHEGTSYKAEDFFYQFVQDKETYYSLSYAQILNIKGIPIANVLIPAGEAFGFSQEFSPGIYTLRFSLLEDSQLDNFDIRIVENNTYAKARKGLGHGLVQSAEKLRYEYESAYWEIRNGDNGSSNEYLFLLSQNPLRDNSEVIHDAYTLLDEEDQIQNISDYMSDEKLLYVISNPDSAESLDTSKLYIYDLLTTGNRFIYENNANHFIDLVCEDIPFLAKDEDYIEKVTIETRINSFPADINTPTMRLKIKNSENSNEAGEPIEYYIDAEGNVVTGEEAWRDYEDQQLRWDLYLDNIGSYKVICEVLVSRKLIIEAGAKILTVKYKTPWRIFDTKKNYFGWSLGINPTGKLELLNGNDRDVISFYKDGYYFNPDTAEIWTNIECSKLLVEY